MGSGSSRRRDAARVSVAEEGTGGNGGDDGRGAAQADNGGNTEVIHRQQSVHRTSLYPGTQEPPHSALRVDSLHGAADSSTEEDASFPPASVGQFDGSDNPVVASKRASGKGATHKRNSGGRSQQQPAGAEQSPGKKESWFKAAGRAKKKSKPTARPSVILRSVTCAQAHGHGCGCKRQRLRWHVGPVAVAAPVCACGCVCLRLCAWQWRASPGPVRSTRSRLQLQQHVHRPCHATLTPCRPRTHTSLDTSLAVAPVSTAPALRVCPGLCVFLDASGTAGHCSWGHERRMRGCAA